MYTIFSIEPKLKHCLKNYRILGSRRGGIKEFSLIEGKTICSGERQVAHLKNISPPFQGSKSKPTDVFPRMLSWILPDLAGLNAKRQNSSTRESIKTDSGSGFPSNATLVWIFYSVTATCFGWFITLLITFMPLCQIVSKKWLMPWYRAFH
jgi:hypothetical protein